MTEHKDPLSPMDRAIADMAYLTDGPLCSGRREDDLEKLDAAAFQYLRHRRKLMSPTVYRAIHGALGAGVIEGQISSSHASTVRNWIERFRPVVMDPQERSDAAVDNS